jgi:ABC-type uncharacterized transport system substrate-binding protein
MPARINDYRAELVKFAPDIIVANGSLALGAMEQAMRSIPIVFAVVNDPVEQAFIPSMAHEAKIACCRRTSPPDRGR